MAKDKADKNPKAPLRRFGTIDLLDELATTRSRGSKDSVEINIRVQIPAGKAADTAYVQKIKDVLDSEFVTLSVAVVAAGPIQVPPRGPAKDGIQPDMPSPDPAAVPAPSKPQPPAKKKP